MEMGHKIRRRGIKEAVCSPQEMQDHASCAILWQGRRNAGRKEREGCSSSTQQQRSMTNDFYREEPNGEQIRVST
jgi:hypothetical protein